MLKIELTEDEAEYVFAMLSFGRSESVFDPKLLSQVVLKLKESKHYPQYSDLVTR